MSHLSAAALLLLPATAVKEKRRNRRRRRSVDLRILKRYPAHMTLGTVISEQFSLRNLDNLKNSIFEDLENDSG